MGRWFIWSAALPCAALFAVSAVAETPAPRLRSGMYEALMLAVDPQGEITGYYREELGDASCSFFLAGKVADGATPVMTWDDERFPGTLTPESHGVELRIERGREHPGCGLVLMPQIASGLSYSLSRETKWRELRRIADKRAHFHSAPSDAKKMRAFVVTGDVVGVLAESGEWLEVEYPGKKKTTRGWVRATATQKLTATPTAPAPSPSEPSPGTLSMKLNDSQAALDFLETSTVKLQEGRENCADLAELGTLGALVKKLRAEATERTIQCEAEASTKSWSCKAEFNNSGGEEEEATGFAIQLQYRVDDATRTVQPDSLVCLMAG